GACDPCRDGRHRSGDSAGDLSPDHRIDFRRTDDEPIATMKQFSDEQIDRTVTDAVASGANGDLPHPTEPPEVRQAKDLALRYRLPFVNLLPQDGESPIDYSLLNEIPVDLMLRNQFVPLRRENGKLHIAMADPTDLDRLDDLASALRARLV